MNFEKTIQAIPQLHTHNHAHVIHGLVRWLKPTLVMEIGAYMGYMTCWLAKGLQENGLPGSHLFVVDDFSLHEGNPANITNALAYTECNHVKTTIMPMRSQDIELWPRLDMAFIDGDHSYEGVKHDFDKCVAAGAYCLIIHDTVGWHGPRRFIEELDRAEWHVLEVNFDSGLGICIKKFQKPECLYKEGAAVL